MTFVSLTPAALVSTQTGVLVTLMVDSKAFSLASYRNMSSNDCQPFRAKHEKG